MPQRRPHGFHCLAGQHRSHRFNRHGNNERNIAADFLRKPANGEDGRFDIPGVLAGFHEQQIHSAFHQPFCLRVVGVAQFVERNAACHCDRLGGRPHGTGDKPRLPRRAEFIRRLPRQFGRALVQ